MSHISHNLTADSATLQKLWNCCLTSTQERVPLKLTPNCMCIYTVYTFSASKWSYYKINLWDGHVDGQNNTSNHESPTHSLAYTSPHSFTRALSHTGKHTRTHTRTHTFRSWIFLDCHIYSVCPVDRLLQPLHLTSWCYVPLIMSYNCTVYIDLSVLPTFSMRW